MERPQQQLSQLMSTPVLTVPRRSTFLKALNVMNEAKKKTLVLVDDNNKVGEAQLLEKWRVLLLSDAEKEGEIGNSLGVLENVVKCAETDSIGAVRGLLQKNTAVIVTDGQDQPVGIITSADLATKIQYTPGFFIKQTMSALRK